MVTDEQIADELLAEEEFSSDADILRPLLLEKLRQIAAQEQLGELVVTDGGIRDGT